MRASAFFITCCLLAAVAPLLRVGTNAPTAMENFPGWPAQFAGRALTELPLTEREQRFAEDFPGRIGRFSDGSREIILRWVTRETRTLHPAADCFKGVGYAVRPLPVRIDEAGRAWGSFAAQRGAEVLHVYERIYEANDEQQGWTDVSTWYWRALLGRTAGGWWAVTLAERQL